MVTVLPHVALSHVALCVFDLERSTAFYVEALGCLPARPYHGTGPEVSRLMEVPDADFDGVFLRCGTGFIELLRYGSAPAPARGAAPLRQADAPGLAHLSLLVNDVDAVLAAVTSRAGTVLERIAVPFGHQAPTLMAFVLDPDGNRIELISHPDVPSASAHARFLGLDGLGWPDAVGGSATARPETMGPKATGPTAAGTAAAGPAGRPAAVAAAPAAGSQGTGSWGAGGPRMTPEAGVRELVYRYAHLGDRGDAAGLAALFLADGVLETAHGVRAEGRAAIAAYLGALADRDPDGRRPAFVRHHVASVDVVECEPDHALARSYFLVITGAGFDHSGRYRDLVKPDAAGVWRFAHRYVRLDAPPRSPVFMTPFRA